MWKSVLFSDEALVLFLKVPGVENVLFFKVPGVETCWNALWRKICNPYSQVPLSVMIWWVICKKHRRPILFAFMWMAPSMLIY